MHIPAKVLRRQHAAYARTVERALGAAGSAGAALVALRETVRLLDRLCESCVVANRKLDEYLACTAVRHRKRRRSDDEPWSRAGRRRLG